MTAEPVELAEILLTRERMIAELQNNPGQQERKFLLSLARAEPDWSLLEIEHLEQLPAIRWRLQNLRRLAENESGKVAGSSGRTGAAAPTALKTSGGARVTRSRGNHGDSPASPESRSDTMSTVLVTGGSGFIAGHCILQLLGAGHQVRATVRNLAREGDVRATLSAAGAEVGGRLSFFAADLEADAGWAEAVTGCDYVLHVASPFPAAAPKDEDELIVPAREGALRVLRASRDAGVKRVVLTSSFAAIGYGHKWQERPFDETSWSDTNAAGVSAYAKSKTLAERAAWDFVAAEGGNLELSVINPVGVFGPVLGTDYSTSIAFIKRMFDGGLIACPRLYFGVVDVRDVASLHLTAMTDPAAKGERFLAVAGDSMSILEMAQVLRSRLGAAASKVPSRELPDWLVRLAALRDPALKQTLPELGKKKSATNAKAKRVLGWSPKSNADAIAATGATLVRLTAINVSPPVSV
jgi:nucleoside-diphosphate-sugar epimerase